VLWGLGEKDPRLPDYKFNFISFAAMRNNCCRMILQLDYPLPSSTITIQDHQVLETQHRDHQDQVLLLPMN
jgi:hypothetical protein